MENISTLIQEAKPLYFTRKKRRHRLKLAASVLGCFLLAQTAFIIHSRISVDDLDGLYTYLYDNTAFEKSFAFATIASDSAMPLDEYGLLAVL